MRIAGWSKLTSVQLWDAWLKEFPSQTDAEATAVWIANRLVKNAAVSTRRRFYEVKDIFLDRYSRYLVEGRIVRQEIKTCRVCGGSGWSERFQDECERCDDGIYQRRFLYVHNLNIEGTRYSFHSYEKPRVISDLPGEDKEAYGGKFTESEFKELQLPCSGLVRMLRYAAFARWPASTGMQKVNMVKFDCHCRSWYKNGIHSDYHHDLCRLK
jgi:hypothetical protein